MASSHMRGLCTFECFSFCGMFGSLQRLLDLRLEFLYAAGESMSPGTGDELDHVLGLD